MKIILSDFMVNNVYSQIFELIPKSISIGLYALRSTQQPLHVALSVRVFVRTHTHPIGTSDELKTINFQSHNNFGHNCVKSCLLS